MTIAVDGRMIGSSGIGRYLRSVLEILVQHRCTLIVLGNQEEIRHWFPHASMRIIDFRMPVYHPLSVFMLKTRIPECDIYYSPHFTTTPFRTKAKKRIATIHDVFHLTPISGFGWGKRVYAGLLYRATLSASDLVLTVSGDSRAALQRHFSMAADIHVVWNGVDPAVFFPDRVQTPPLKGEYGLFVGNLKAHKRLDVAIDALATCKVPGLSLVVVGGLEGQMHSADATTMKKLDLPSVTRVQNPDDTTLRALYSNARFLVFPTVHEGFGYPAVEAMACGCPVICSRIPVLEEICGEAALYCTPDSTEEFAQRIRELCLDSALRVRMIGKGHERAALFTMETFSARIAALFGVSDVH